MGRILGAGGAVREIGAAVGGVAEVFVGNQAERDAGAQARFQTSVGQFADEFSTAGSNWFDRLVNGLNRLPRPLLALGTLGLFVYSMAEPAGFSVRMEGLALVPEPLWWLLGAIVSFYFGARELHHIRSRPRPAAAQLASTSRPATLLGTVPSAPVAVRADDPDFNAAIEEWQRLRA